MMLLTLTGCGGGFFAEEDLQIVSVEAVPGKEGFTNLVVTYADESDRDPDVFPIPNGKDGEKGEEGATGTGISKLTYQHNDQKRNTSVLFEFTDKNLAPVAFDIPDGLSVSELIPYVDPIAGYCMILKYNDGTQSDPFPIPKGERGNGIRKFECVQNDDLSVNINVELDDSEPINVFIPGPRGISEMVSGESDGAYYITVKYTDNSEQTLTFERPSKWFHGTTVPSNLLGVVGDYFFDTAHDKMYLKEELPDGTIKWNEIASIRSEKYDVRFELNDDGDAFMNNANVTYTVERGSYFSADGNGKIPVPIRPGYTFLGWYQEKIVDETTMSPFTDFTPVFSHLVLYARWQKN
jgi:uncharacterized repeat protein (TIGR02543 family)